MNYLLGIHIPPTQKGK